MTSSPDITIIVPIHNRVLFLPQVLEYYHRLKGEVNPRIVIADSSSPDNFDLNKEVVGRYRDLSILHLPIRGADQSLYGKIIEALKFVETEFCVCCADDDFITVTGLKETTNFLKRNADFVVAHGSYISFHTRPYRGKQELYWSPNYFTHSVDADSPTERLTDQFLHCKHTLYAVHRTEVLKHIYSEVRNTLNTNVKILLFGEFLSTMLATVMGKIKDLDILYAARREDASYQGHHIKWPLIRDYAEDGRIKGEWAEFKESIVKHLISAQPGLSREKAYALVDNGFEDSLKKGLVPDRFRHFVLHTANFLKNKSSPDWIYNLFKKIYRTFVPVKRGGRTGDFSGTNLAPYNNDLKILREVILGHGSRPD